MAVIAFPNPTHQCPEVPQNPSGAKKITPSDVDTFERPVHVLVGGSGTVVVRPANGQPVIALAGTAGQILPIMVTAVLASGDGTTTTATGLVALY